MRTTTTTAATAEMIGYTTAPEQVTPEQKADLERAAPVALSEDNEYFCTHRSYVLGASVTIDGAPSIHTVYIRENGDATLYDLRAPADGPSRSYPIPASVMRRLVALYPAALADMRAHRQRLEQDPDSDLYIGDLC